MENKEYINKLEEKVEDDGTLAFLNLPRREDNKQFHCDTINQSDLINRTFWIVDYQPNVKTKFGENKYLVHIKFELDDEESKGKKFFTGSAEIKDVLDQIKALNKFPRKVTLKMQKQIYWLV